MTKNQDLQKELTEKVKPGVKPSDLKKLKKSKSADDISLAPTTKIKQLEDEISVLALKLETKERELTEKDANLTIYSEQLKAKQKELESLRKQLEETNTKLTDTNQELDNCLKARHNSLKDWKQQQEIIKKLNEELDQTIDQASDELIANDDKISQLRTKINQLKTVKDSLERELKLEKNKKKTHPQPLNSSDNSYSQATFYALLAIGILFLATNITVSFTAPNEH